MYGTLLLYLYDVQDDGNDKKGSQKVGWREKRESNGGGESKETE